MQRHNKVRTRSRCVKPKGSPRSETDWGSAPIDNEHPHIQPLGVQHNLFEFLRELIHLLSRRLNVLPSTGQDLLDIGIVKSRQGFNGGLQEWVKRVVPVEEMVLPF